MAKSISRRLADSASPTGAIDGTLSTAAQTNITSVGTLSSLVIADGATIGSASDTNSITISSAGVVTLDQIPVFSAGINVSNPIILTAGALAAAGNAGLSHRSTDNKVYLQAGTGGFNILDDQQNTHFSIDSAGVSSFNNNVGIGDDNPSDKFVVKGDGASIGVESADMQVALLGKRSSSGVGLDQGYLRLRNQGVTADGAVVDSAGDSYFNGGNVGIGTAAPDTNLHVNRGAGGTAFKVETTSGQHTVQGSDAAGTYIEQTGTTAATKKFRLQNQDGSNNYTQLIIDGHNRRIEVIPGLDVHDVGTVYTGAGTGKGTIHLDPASTTNFAGNAITFGASDTGNGQNAHAGIYTRTDGSLGTEMHLSTTDSYSSGSKTGIKISNLGNVTVPRGYLAAKQPAAIARGVGAWQTSYTQAGWNELHSLVAFTQYNNSVGAPWSDSTGRFTAPIAGYYLCTLSVYAQNTSPGGQGVSYAHPQWAKNGNVNIHGVTPYQIYGHDATGTAASYPDGIGRADILYCAEGDYITAQLYLQGPNWQFYRNYCAVSFCLISAV